MNLAMDPDVQSVAEFMQRNLSADRLVDVCRSLALLSEPLWGHYPKAMAPAIQLEAQPISALQPPAAT